MPDEVTWKLLKIVKIPLIFKNIKKKKLTELLQDVSLIYTYRHKTRVGDVANKRLLLVRERDLCRLKLSPKFSWHTLPLTLLRSLKGTKNNHNNNNNHTFHPPSVQKKKREIKRNEKSPKAIHYYPSKRYREKRQTEKGIKKNRKHQRKF